MRRRREGLRREEWRGEEKGRRREQNNEVKKRSLEMRILKKMVQEKMFVL